MYSFFRFFCNSVVKKRVKLSGSILDFESFDFVMKFDLMMDILFWFFLLNISFYSESGVYS